MDLQAGYWQLRIREEDKHKTAFTWRNENLEFERIPFGWTASGPAFCRAVATAFQTVNFDNKKVISYIDDICILGKDINRFIANHIKTKLSGFLYVVLKNISPRPETFLQSVLC